MPGASHAVLSAFRLSAQERTLPLRIDFAALHLNGDVLCVDLSATKQRVLNLLPQVGR